MVNRGFVRLFFTGFMLLVLAACGGGGEDNDDAVAGPTETRTPAESVFTTNISGENPGIEGGDRLLAWVGAAAAPGQQSASAPGQIVFINGNGDTQTLMDVPVGTSRVHACGEQATSPDGRYFAFFVGGDNGTLYLMDGTREPREVRDMFALGCASVATFQYTPDSERFAYIDFEPDAPSSDFAHGFLYVYSTGDVEQVTRFDNVTAFDASDTGLAFLGFFTDSQGRATEAAVSLWDQSGEPDEITTLFADSGCQFTSGQVVFTGPTALAVVMGQRCNGSGSSWDLYTVDITAGTATRADDGTAAGSFLSYARTNGLYAQVGGGIVYYTIPDGLTANTVSVRSAALAAPDAGEDVFNNGVMPRFNSRPYDPDNSATPVLSPDGRWVAMSSRDASGNASVDVMDLADADGLAFPIRAGSGSIVSMAFTLDSAQLLYVSGGNNGGDNSLFALDLARGVETRIARGHFVELIPAPDNLAVAASTWTFPDDPNQPMYMTLDIIALPGGEMHTLARAAQITDDERVRDRHFIYPLSWRG